MGENLRAYFEALREEVHRTLVGSEVLRFGLCEEYGFLKMRGKLGKYIVTVSEVLERSGRRKYSYYFLEGERILSGFDNAPEPKIVKTKWGNAYRSHLHDLIPHRHISDKTSFDLTDEVCFGEAVTFFREMLHLLGS